MSGSFSDNIDSYKSYIQKRRAGSSSGDNTVDSVIKKTDSIYDSSLYNAIRKDVKAQTSDDGWETPLKLLLNEVSKDNDNESAIELNRKNAPGSNKGSPRTNIYQKLNRLHKRTSRQNTSYQSRYKSYLQNAAEIEDNRTAMLAIKIIKQSLACFAILGVIVFMQQRNDMDHILSFIKTHVVDTHIEPTDILTSVGNFAKQCTRFLGGLP